MRNCRCPAETLLITLGHFLLHYNPLFLSRCGTGASVIPSLLSPWLLWVQVCDCWEKSPALAIPLKQNTSCHLDHWPVHWLPTEIPLPPWHGNHLATEQLLGILFPFCSLHHHRTVTGLEMLIIFQEPTKRSTVLLLLHRLSWWIAAAGESDFSQRHWDHACKTPRARRADSSTRTALKPKADQPSEPNLRACCKLNCELKSLETTRCNPSDTTCWRKALDKDQTTRVQLHMPHWGTAPETVTLLQFAEGHMFSAAAQEARNCCRLHS